MGLDAITALAQRQPPHILILVKTATSSGGNTDRPAVAPCDTRSDVSGHRLDGLSERS
jgi:hypothetical protein